MARVIEFYTPKSFILANRTMAPNNAGRLIEFPGTNHVKKSA